jgi:photosystem II stability/assembly factor-like uncharacterized protein
MKRFYTLIFALLISLASSAQWSIIYNNTLAPIEELRGVFFTSPDTGVIVGAQTVIGNPAIIRRTTDGGTSWTDIYCVYTDTLRAVWFTSSNTGFACGAKGRIIKTIDGGQMWDTVYSGTSNLLRSVNFPTPEIGYICGGNGTILKTADGGFTWTQQVCPTTQDLINIRFLNSDTGYCCSSLATFLSGMVLRTYDGGANWNIVYTDAQGLLGIAIADANKIISGGGSQVIVRTTDGGQTWANTYTGNSGTNMRGSWFINPDTGWVVGDLGSLFETNNGGASWTPIALLSQALLGIHFPVSDTGYAVGNGVIIKYTAPCTLPAPDSITASSAVACSFDTLTFCVPPLNGATSYTWTIPPGNTILSGQGDTCISVALGSQTSGTISCHADNICGAGDSVSFTLVVQITPPAPSISLIGNQLYSSTTSGIQWYLNGVAIPGETNQFYTPISNGNYTVVYTSPAGCTAESAPYYFLDVGISSASPENGIYVYHNHTDNKLEIGNRKLEIKGAEIVTALGQRIYKSENCSSRKLVVDVTDFAAGVYFVKITTALKSVTAKIIISR